MNVNLKMWLVLITLPLLFSCKGKKQVTSHSYTDGMRTYKASIEVYLEQQSVFNHFLGTLAVVNRRTTEIRQTEFGPFLVDPRQAGFLYRDSVFTEAMPGDTLSFYLLVKADIPTAYIFSFLVNDRLVTSVRDTLFMDPKKAGAFTAYSDKRVDVVVK